MSHVAALTPIPGHEYRVVVNGDEYWTVADAQGELHFRRDPVVFAQIVWGCIDLDYIDSRHARGEISAHSVREYYKETGISVRDYCTRFPEDRVTTPFWERCPSKDAITSPWG